jgi:UDP-N-acetylglucosamine 2-epimerase (non-hydrolysing)
VIEMKIATVIGARPQFIKMAPVSRELRKHFSEIIIHTGQHYDYEMNQIFFDELKISEADYHLGVGSGSHAYQTGEMLKLIEEVLMKEKPDFVLTYGDTNSTLAGALVGVKLHIKVGHVEAGMRSFDKSMPEEINRILTDHCSDLLFCSTGTAVENLKREGIINGVYLTGDVMVDSLLYNKEIAENKSKILNDLDLKSKGYLVATIHRAGNTDNKENLRNIVDAFSEVEETIVFPVHPRTEKFLKEYGFYDKLKASVKLVNSLGYLNFLKLMIHAKKIITDSGGIQKEAYILKVPCVTLRENTEWVETVDDGWNVLVGTNKEKIARRVKEFEPLSGTHKDRFGNGDASRKIVEVLRNKGKPEWSKQ